MSYDIYIEDEFGVEVGSTNITYNVSPMFKLAFDNEKGINILQDLSTDDALPLLIKAYRDMYHNPEKYDVLNPPNGWGSRETTVKALHNIINHVIIGENCKIFIC